MKIEKIWPAVGDKLVHNFRKKSGSVVAEVLSINKENEEIVLRIGADVFPSLSAAAHSITGAESNGWIYWGLKKQGPKKKYRRKG